MKLLKHILISFSFVFSSLALATPERIVNLTVTPGTSANVMLSFTMPAPGPGLTITAVECRQSQQPISTLTWGTRSLTTNQPPIVQTGRAVSFFTTVPFNTQMYFACKTRDTAWSAVSNTPSLSPLPAPVYMTATLEWTQPTDLSKIDNYVVFWKEQGAADYSVVNQKSLPLGVSAAVLVPWGKVWCFVMASVDKDATVESEAISGRSNEACRLKTTQ